MIRKKRGFTTIEAIEAIALFALIVTGLVTTILYAQEASMIAGNRSRAMLIAKEGMEAVRNIRDENYDNVIEGEHGLSYENGQYTLTSVPDTTGIYTRNIQVYVVDDNNKDIRVTVTWQQNSQRTGSVQVDERLTNWRRTTETESGDWTNPTIVTQFDTTGSSNAVKVATKDDYAFVVRESATNGLYVVHLPLGEMPHLVTSIALNNNLTNIAICGNYAYISSTNDSAELQIVDISSPESPHLEGTYDASGSADGNSLQCSGTTVFLSRNFSFQHEFLVLNASNPTSVSIIGSCDLNITSGYDMAIKGNVAYVAASFIVAPFNIVSVMTLIDITNLSSPSIINRYVEWTDWGGSLAITSTGNDMFMGQGSPGNRLYAYDISTPTNPVLKANIEYDGQVNDIAIGRENKMIFVGTSDSAKEFTVVDIQDMDNVHQIASIDMPGSINGLSYMPEQDMVVSVSSANDAEIIIVTSGKQ